MSTALAITALLLWLAVFFESASPGKVRRIVAILFLFLVFLVSWVFTLVSGWNLDISLNAPDDSTEPTRILYEDSLL